MTLMLFISQIKKLAKSYAGFATSTHMSEEAQEVYSNLLDKASQDKRLASVLALIDMRILSIQDLDSELQYSLLLSYIDNDIHILDNNVIVVEEEVTINV